MNFYTIFEENKKLDKLFDQKHNQNDLDIFRKNILELLVELGEFANETRVFKYWSIKPPSDKSIILEELADVLQMIMAFINQLGSDINFEFEEGRYEDEIKQFIYLYNLFSTVEENFNKEHLEKMFSNTIHLANKLGYTNEEIINACILKINKNKIRLEQDFKE